MTKMQKGHYVAITKYMAAVVFSAYTPSVVYREPWFEEAACYLVAQTELDSEF